MKYAFTLLELLIFIVLSSMSVFLVLQCVTRIQKRNSTLTNKYVQHRTMILALDVLRRDIWHASYRMNEWCDEQNVFRRYHLNAKKELVHIDVGWYVKKGFLVRAQGNYNFVHKAWKSKRTSVVAQKIQSFYIQKHGTDKEHIRKVDIHYVCNDCRKTEMLLCYGIV